MNDIDNLKEIGLNEIARKTHIEAEYLGYIIDRNYEKLMRFNVKGFIKILEREYGVDFKDWLEEYDKFISEHKEDKANKTISVGPKISAYTAENKSSSRLLQIIILLAVLIFLIWFFEGYKHMDGISNLFADKNRSVNYSNNSVVEQAEKNINTIKEMNNTVIMPIVLPAQDANDSQDLNRSDSREIDNKTSDNPQDVLTTDQAPLSAVTKPAKEENIDMNTSENFEPNKNVSNSSKTEYVTTGLSEIKIVPRKKVWLGVINLENDTKRSTNVDKEFIISLDKRQLVVTGHGEVNLEIGKEVVKFKTDNTRRFLIEPNKVTLIDFEEFKSLNKGKPW